MSTFLSILPIIIGSCLPRCPNANNPDNTIPKNKIT